MVRRAVSENRRLTDFAADAGPDASGAGEDEGASDDAPTEAADDNPSAGGDEPVDTEDGGPASDPTAVAGQADGEATTTATEQGEAPTSPTGPAVTFTADPDGGPCAECGATTTRRWADGDRLVCPACKEW